MNYDVNTSLGGTVGVNIFEKLKSGYAFDHPTNSLVGYTRGTHSMFLSFNLDNFTRYFIESGL
ncbi:MAG TPA: type IX secretion system membrane protein PorP/SprF [Cyclobacteriaceae bacterium]|nr:type IX secretion system membrane protein PorP/SprF [Cyclobacteriaceae bacterium]